MIQNHLDQTARGYAQSAERVVTHCSGFVADEIAQFRQCSGVAGPSMNSRVLKRRDGYVMDKMAALSQCDVVTGP